MFPHEKLMFHVRVHMFPAEKHVFLGGKQHSLDCKDTFLIRFRKIYWPEFNK